MEVCIVMLLASLTSAEQFIVKRLDKGDVFTWSQNVPGPASLPCGDFSDHTAWQSGDYCQCDYKCTFSPEDNKCKQYREQVYYRFYEDGSGTNPIKCVYVECDHNMCIFKSSVTKNEMPIATSSNVLPSHDHCKANFVEIIHDCIPRCVDLKLQFTSYGNKLYLQLLYDTATPLSYLEGELFKVDVTCDENAHKKLMFKYNGTRILSNKGSFPNIPAYDPSHTCSASVIDSSTTTNAHLSTSVVPPSPGRRGHAHHSTPLAIIIGIPTIVTILILVGMCCIKHVRKMREKRRATR